MASEAEVVFDQAEKLRSSGEYDEAERLYTKVVDILQTIKNSDASGESVEDLLCQSYNNRGLVKYLKVDFEEAINDYSEALKHQVSAATYYNRGLIQYRLARFDMAIEDMEQALTLDPDFESAQQCLKQCKIDKDTQRRKDELNSNL